MVLLYFAIILMCLPILTCVVASPSTQVKVCKLLAYLICISRICIIKIADIYVDRFLISACSYVFYILLIYNSDSLFILYCLLILQ